MPSSRQHTSLAAQKYVQALSATQSAVKNPEKWDSDALLATILVMAAWVVWRSLLPVESMKKLQYDA